MSSPNDVLNILVVEDNAVNQIIAVRLLKSLGYACDLAVDGFRCLEMVVGKRYDLILLDIEMPGIDGLETVRRLREFESQNQLTPSYVVACTAFRMTGHREKCLEAGMDDYLAKPMDPKLVEKLIENLLALRKLQN